MTLNLNLATYSQTQVVHISFTGGEKTANSSRILLRINGEIALMKYQHIWPHTTIWKRRSFQTRLKLFRTQWALIRLAESLTFIHGGLNENLFQYKRNSVAACKKFEAQKKFFYLFHLYVNSLFVLTSFSLNLLTQNSVLSLSMQENYMKL